MDTGTRLRDILETILEPIEECSQDKTLGQVLKIFNQGKPILLHCGAWYFILPEAAVGYPTSRRVIDLPVSDAPVLAPDLPVREVAATLSQQGHPYGLVVHGQQLLGLVSEKRLQEYLNTRAREQAEEQRRISDERLRDLIEGSIQGIIIHHHFQPLLANQAAADMFGYPLAEMCMLDTTLRLIAPHEHARIMEYAEAWLHGQEAPTHYEFQGVRKDGRMIWAEDRVRVVTWGGVLAVQETIVDISELRAAREQLQLVSRRLLCAQEDERRHLARELHDEIGQLLTALNLILQRAAGVSAIQTKRMLHDAQAMVTDLRTRVQDLSLDLRPSMLDDLGLRPALEWLLQKYSAHTQVKATLEHAGLERRFPADVETAAYRIVQEGLTNIARHAEAREARVRVRTEPGKLSLHIEDWGKGFDVDAALAAGASSGLAGMQERALLAGGTLQLFSQPGMGTVVSAEFPL